MLECADLERDLDRDLELRLDPAGDGDLEFLLEPDLERDRECLGEPDRDRDFWEGDRERDFREGDRDRDLDLAFSTDADLERDLDAFLGALGDRDRDREPFLEPDGERECGELFRELAADFREPLRDRERDFRSVSDFFGDSPGDGDRDFVPFLGAEPERLRERDDRLECTEFAGDWSRAGDELKI